MVHSRKKHMRQPGALVAEQVRKKALDGVLEVDLLGVAGGLYDVSTRWAVTHDLAQWKDEIAWMSLYFSAAVWSSLALGSFALIRGRLHRYRRSPGRWSRQSPRLLPARSQGTF